MKRRFVGVLVAIALCGDVYAAGADGGARSIAECDYAFTEVKTPRQLARLVRDIKAQGVCAIDTETTGFRPMHGDSIVGLSVCAQEGKAYYVHCQRAGVGNLLPYDMVTKELGAVFADRSIKKYMHNARYDMSVLWPDMAVHGLTFDTMVAAQFIGEPAGLKTLSEDHLEEKMLSFKQVVEKRGYRDFLEAYLGDQAKGIDMAVQYASADAHQTFRLVPILTALLKKEGRWDQYKKIEGPLVSILSTMECRGLGCNKPYLVELKGRGFAESGEAIIEKLIKAHNPFAGTIHLVGGPTYLATSPIRHTKTFVVADVPAEDALIRQAIIAPDGYTFVGARLESDDMKRACKEAIVLFEQERVKEAYDAYTALQVEDQWVVASALGCVAQVQQLMSEVVEDIDDLEVSLRTEAKRRRGAADAVFKVGQTWAQVSEE